MLRETEASGGEADFCAADCGGGRACSAHVVSRGSLQWIGSPLLFRALANEEVLRQQSLIACQRAKSSVDDDLAQPGAPQLRQRESQQTSSPSLRRARIPVAHRVPFTAACTMVREAAKGSSSGRGYM